MITGGLGYIGSVVAQYLQERGYETDIVDLKCGRDIFDLESEDFINIDAVVHLAAIVGDAACDANKELAIKTNVEGTRYIKNLADFMNIPLIFASTCSVYGPWSLYKETKVQAEDLLNGHCILRFGTAFGWSPNMRYNLVVNKFVLDAKMKGKLSVFGGEQWRPFVHVKDIARNIEMKLKDYKSGVFDLVHANLQIASLSRIIQKEIPGTIIEVNNNISDVRNYKRPITPFCYITIKYGIREILDHIIEVNNYTIKKEVKYLI